MTALSGDASDAVNPQRAYPPGVIVAGMHRSATSLVASTLVACGWRAPGELLKADHGNTRGYFEDRRMHDLHRRLLESYETAWDLGPRLRKLRKRTLSLSPREATVEEVVGEFRSDGPWVWKNPRATLFLDGWAERFPEAQFVICVRSPSSVIDSMWRRGDRLRITNKVRLYKLKRTARMISVWHRYNAMAYRFARRHPDRAIVVRIPDDLDVLAASTQPRLFDPAMLQNRAPLQLRAIAGLAVSSQLLYWRLRRLHDATRLAVVLAGPGNAGAAGVHENRGDR
jgi:hypothetical protein